MKQLIDKPNNQNIRVFDRMVAELSRWMTDEEIDKCVGFLDQIAGSQWDINPTLDDSKTQLKIILGGDRYEEIKAQWSIKNQHLIKDGKTKYIHKTTKKVYDGLDPHDDPLDYTMIKM
jgi:hypothetical protein